jgi:transposase
MRVEMRDSVDDLQGCCQHESKVRVVDRLRIIVGAMQQRTAKEISGWLGVSERKVQFWVHRYNEQGVEGLRDRKGGGPKPMLRPEQETRLKARLDAGPLPCDGVCTLRGEDVRRILRDEFGIVRKLGAVYKLLHAMGYSSLAPRPQHRDADPQAQAAFKKSSLGNLPESPTRILIEKCESSSKMKHALVSKAR